MLATSGVDAAWDPREITGVQVHHRCMMASGSSKRSLRVEGGGQVSDRLSHQGPVVSSGPGRRRLWSRCSGAHGVLHTGHLGPGTEWEAGGQGCKHRQCCGGPGHSISHTRGWCQLVATRWLRARSCHPLASTLYLQPPRPAAFWEWAQSPSPAPHLSMPWAPKCPGLWLCSMSSWCSSLSPVGH